MYFLLLIIKVDSSTQRHWHLKSALRLNCFFLHFFLNKTVHVFPTPLPPNMPSGLRILMTSTAGDSPSGSSWPPYSTLSWRMLFNSEMHHFRQDIHVKYLFFSPTALLKTLREENMDILICMKKYQHKNTSLLRKWLLLKLCKLFILTNLSVFWWMHYSWI